MPFSLKLRWQFNDHLHEHVIAAPDVVKIGRKSTCDIILSDDRISREHALIVGRHDGSYYLQNTSRSIPIYFKMPQGTDPLPFGEEIKLEPGFVFQLGPIALLASHTTEDPDTNTIHLTCSNCGQPVHTSHNNCPWCDTHLASGRTSVTQFGMQPPISPD